MTGPQRIQLRRTKGWRLPEGAVSVARPTRWGNPHSIAQVVYPEERQGPWWQVLRNGRPSESFIRRDTAIRVIVTDFRLDLWHGRLPYSCDDVREALAGRDLACWCPVPDKPARSMFDWTCHGDALLDVANS